MRTFQLLSGKRDCEPHGGAPTKAPVTMVTAATALGMRCSASQPILLRVTPATSAARMSHCMDLPSDAAPAWGNPRERAGCPHAAWTPRYGRSARARASSATGECTAVSGTARCSGRRPRQRVCPTRSAPQRAWCVWGIKSARGGSCVPHRGNCRRCSTWCQNRDCETERRRS